MDQLRVGLGIFFGALGVRMAIGAWSDIRTEKEKVLNAASEKRRAALTKEQVMEAQRKEHEQKLHEMDRNEKRREEDHQIIIEKEDVRSKMIREINITLDDQTLDINQKIDIVKRLHEV